MGMETHVTEKMHTITVYLISPPEPWEFAICRLLFPGGVIIPRGI
jgi:hypothetical protein